MATHRSSGDASSWCRSRRERIVTGGAAFIGANLVHHLQRRHSGVRQVALDALTNENQRINLTPIDSGATSQFIQGNVRETGLVEELHRRETLDTVTHVTGETHVDGSDYFISTHYTCTHHILEPARLADNVPERRSLTPPEDQAYGSPTKEQHVFPERTLFRLNPASPAIDPRPDT